MFSSRFNVGVVVSLCTFGAGTNAGISVPAGRTGATIHVSKLGDNTDGRSWQTAFHTIQKALLAVPDDKGGHRVVVRPDTYMEANLYTTHKGAAGAYNELVGDYDGKLGSGTTGWVVIDSGDPAKGFKSYDWWSTIRAYSKGWSKEHKEETFSSIIWDRWAFRRLYATGGDAGIFFDGTNKVEPFTVIVEDCISIGRAFGGGVGNVLSRTGEPMVFRRCHLWALDEWGDTAGAYVRVENPTMPNRPDVCFEDCTMVGPQCSLKGSNYGFKTFTYAGAKRCRLVTLNFSQPQGTPTDGIVQSVQHGKYLKVDFEDCTLMGYKVFGVKVEKATAKEIQYNTKGSCLAYVQYQQEVPKGFLRIGYWPVEVFSTLIPPEPRRFAVMLEDETLIRRDLCEIAPIVWQGRLCHMECIRPATGGAAKDYYLLLKDAETGKELARFAEGYSLACATVHDGRLYVFASRFENNDWNDVTLFKSADLKNWEKKVVVTQEKEHLFNSSVCAGPDGFVMAYETNDPTYPAFTIKFATSKDLENWTKLPGTVFGTNRYTACPCIRYADGYYYMMYLEHRVPRWYFQTYIARSKDLKRWWLSAANPVLAPDSLDEGINASDPDIIEFGGKTYVYYAVGDQLTWMNIKRAMYPGLMKDFFQGWFANPGIEDCGTAAYRAATGR
jgi:hypothetical protein